MDSRTVANICSMARDFNENDDISMVELFKRTGRKAKEIDLGAIEQYLASNPGLVESWLTYSLDNRGCPAWGLVSPNESGSSKWVVFHYPGEDEEEFDSGSKSCAVYISKELQNLSGHFGFVVALGKSFRGR